MFWHNIESYLLRGKANFTVELDSFFQVCCIDPSIVTYSPLNIGCMLMLRHNALCNVHSALFTFL